MEVKVPFVPVMRPKLPNADRLLPYLRRIDSGRLYSNFGPLTVELQNRLALHFGMPPDCVVCASCGTAALMAAILATAGPATRDRPYALVPAFTFAATAAAVELCGYRAYLADVDSDSWMLDPERVSHHRLLDRMGVVVPVAPFGRPVAQAPWRTFRKRSGVPVVIDAAASFDCIGSSPAQYFQEVPVVLSFHATKSFGTGEGGCVVSSEAAVVNRAAQALNFGFDTTRDSASASFNGKMSEYHAAIGLAELDGWTAKQQSILEVVQRYRRELSDKTLLSRFFAWPDISGCYALFFCRDQTESDDVQNELLRGGIDFRFWYGSGLHQQTYFSNRERDSLAVTEDIGGRLIGLPMAPDLDEEAIARVAAGLCKATVGPGLRRPRRGLSRSND